MHVIVIGAGIAGPVTAMALQRAGIEATVYEAHPLPEADVGSILTMSPNGLDAVDAIGALDLVREAGFTTRRTVLWNERGRRLGVAELGAPLGDGTAAITVRRPQLARLLAEEAQRRGVRIEYGRRMRGAEVAPGGEVSALFEDGGRATGNVLVGADGVHSVTRRLIDVNAPTGRYVGLTNFGGVTRGVDPGMEPEAWHMIFGRCAFFGYAAAPNGDVFWFVNWPREAITVEERAATSKAEWRSRLAGLFADDTGPAAELIRTGTLELAADNTHDLPHVPVWHRGPLVIIGDAAHAPSPSSGQGASMAAEDAVVLARALRDAPSISAALAGYERARRERVERIVAWGARSSSAKVPGPLGRAVRDIGLRVAFRWFVTPRATAWQYDHRVEWERPLIDAA